MKGERLHRVVQELRTAVRGLGAGARLPTTRVLGQTHGCSHELASRAVQILVAEGVVKRDGYRLSVAEGGKQTQRDIRIWASDVRSSKCQRIRRMARERGFDATVSRWSGIEDDYAALCALGEGYDGMLLWAVGYLKGSIERSAFEGGVPLVFMGTTSQFVSWVIGDWYGSLRLAVYHLRELGHRSVALVCEQNASHPLFGDHFRAIGHEAGMERCEVIAPELRPVRSGGLEHDQMLEVLNDVLTRVTALIVSVDLFQVVLPHVRARKLRIPQDVSVVALGDVRFMGFDGFTAVEGWENEELSFAMDLLVRLIEQKRDLGKARAYPGIVVPTRLVVRRSSGAPRDALEPVRISAGRALDWSALAPRAKGEITSWPVDEEERKLLVQRQNGSSYANMPLRPAGTFQPVDLRGVANRGHSRHRSWLGEAALLHVGPGTLHAHGVPFEILDDRRGAKSCVVLGGTGRESLDKVWIPIGTAARAVYVLHATGRSGGSHTIATYSFVWEDGARTSCPIRVLGRGATQEELADLVGQVAIQDWWPDFHHFQNDTARSYVVTDPTGDPLRYCRYLYSYQWRNGRPDRRVAGLEVTTQMEGRARLAILGVTTLGG